MNQTRCRRPLHAFSTALCVASVLAASGSAHANVNPDLPTRVEALQLPKYCHAEYGIPSNVPVPAAQCGHLMNHFCKGLVALNRASNPTSPKDVKQRSVVRARKNLDYTKRGMPAGCALAGEVEAADARLRTLEVFIK